MLRVSRDELKRGLNVHCKLTNAEYSMLYRPKQELRFHKERRSKSKKSHQCQQLEPSMLFQVCLSDVLGAGSHDPSQVDSATTIEPPRSQISHGPNTHYPISETPSSYPRPPSPKKHPPRIPQPTTIHHLINIIRSSHFQ